MSTAALAKSLYGLVGALFLAVGITVLFFRTGLLPEQVKDIILKEAHDDLQTVHIIQEYATLLILNGLLTFWFLRHYEHSRWFHWAMTVFWGLFALIHWFDVRGALQSITGPLINTIPFLLFLLIGSLSIFSPKRSRLPTAPARS
jgi:hypothetical protein